MAASRFQQRRLLRCALVLSCVAALAPLCAQRAAKAFAVATVAPSMKHGRQASSAPAADVAEAPAESRERERRANDTERNVSTLEFSSGYPSNNEPGTAQNPPWAKCVVEAKDRSQRDEHGTVMPRMVLEEWVMRGTKEHIGTFQGWRQMRKDSPNVRCMETSLDAVLGVNCLECVSPRMDGFVPTPTLTPVGPTGNGLSEVFQTSFVMTFGLPQCLTGAKNGMGFCKSGSVTMTM
jgi:hypothetical protein